MRHVNMSALMAASALARPRAITGIGIRADLNDPEAVLAELNRAWATFQEKHNADLAAIRQGMGDYVQSEQVERINTTITALQATLDEHALRLAAASDAGIGGARLSP